MTTTAIAATPPVAASAARGYRRFTRTSVFAALLLGLVLTTPSAVSYIFLTSSQAAGTVVMAGVVAFFLAPVVRFRVRLFATAMVVAAICGHFFAARYFIPVDTTRFVSSLALLLGLILIAHFMAQWLEEVPDAALGRAIGWLRVAMFVVAILSIAGVEPLRWDRSIPEKAIFPFTEHSHFALIFTPLLLDGCVRARGVARPAWLVAGLLVAVLLQNLTTLIGVALVALITAPLWQIAVLLFVASGAAASMDLTYYLSRLDLSDQTTNLSALVYIQGYEFVVDSFDLTSGWGMGFQQLGIVPMKSLAANVIYALTRGDSFNIYDGGFDASKVISEFGVFGVALVLYFLGVAAVLAMRLRKMALTSVGPDRATALVYSVVVGYTVEMFVRGVGYFSATGFLLIVSFLFLRQQRDRARAA